MDSYALRGDESLRGTKQSFLVSYRPLARLSPLTLLSTSRAWVIRDGREGLN